MYLTEASRLARKYDCTIRRSCWPDKKNIKPAVPCYLCVSEPKVDGHYLDWQPSFGDLIAEDWELFREGD